MAIIDAQVHLIQQSPDFLQPVTIDGMLTAMDSVGVDSALVVNVSRLGPDDRYPFEAASQHPERFAVVAGVDVKSQELDAQIDQLRSHPGLLGIRIVLIDSPQIDLWHAGAYEPVLSAAQRHGLPVCVFPPGRLPELAPAISRHSDLQFVIDHLGLKPSLAIHHGDDPFDLLPDLLALATFPNVAVKATGLPALSRLPFPFLDLWPHLHKIISAFGLQRVMWGTDWTRLVDRCSYEEGVEYLRATTELSATDKEELMGGSLRRIFRWSVGI